MKKLRKLFSLRPSLPDTSWISRTVGIVPFSEKNCLMDCRTICCFGVSIFISGSETSIDRTKNSGYRRFLLKVYIFYLVYIIQGTIIDRSSTTGFLFTSITSQSIHQRKNLSTKISSTNKNHLVRGGFYCFSTLVLDFVRHGNLDFCRLRPSFDSRSIYSLGRHFHHIATHTVGIWRRIGGFIQ